MYWSNEIWYNVGENFHKKKIFEIKLSSIKDGQVQNQSSPWPQNWQYLDCYLTSLKVVNVPIGTPCLTANKQEEYPTVPID